MTRGVQDKIQEDDHRPDCDFGQRVGFGLIKPRRFVQSVFKSRDSYRKN
jgi:hypothetical protein